MRAVPLVRAHVVVFGVALCSVMVVAGGARAATVELFQIDNKSDLTGTTNGFNVASCNPDRDHTITLRIRDLTQPQYSLRFIEYPTGAPGSPCPKDMLDPLTVVIKDQFAAPLVGTRIDDTETLKTSALAEKTGCTTGKRDNVNFCFQLTVLPGDTQALLVGGIPVDLDTSKPGAPSVASVRPGNTSVTLVITPPVKTDAGEVLSYVAQFRVCATTTTTGEGEGEGAGEGEGSEGEGEGASGACNATGDFHETNPVAAPTSGSPTVTIGSLKTDEQIEFRVVAIDDLGNRSEPSALQTTATASDVGPLDLYNGSGGDVSCNPGSTSKTSASSGLGAALFLLSRRGRRLLSRAVAGVKGAAKSAAQTGAQAGAQTGAQTGAKRGGGAALLLVLAIGALAAHPARADFGQLTVDLGVSPYRPYIDSEIKDSHKIFPIYSCVFGDKNLAELGGDVDTHLWDGFGSLQLSFGFAVSQAQGKAQDLSTLSTGTCGKATSTDVQLSLAKLRPGLTYRFDPLLDWWGVPLVPYGRIGFVAEGFMFTKGGDFEKNGSVNPVGLRFGWEAAAGMMLALDFLDAIDPFDPNTTKRGRANGTFDHTFIFVEGAWQPVSSFGAPGFVFTPAPDTFFGTHLPVLWKAGIAVELL